MEIEGQRRSRSPKGQSRWRSSFTMQHYHVCHATAAHPPPHHQARSNRLVLFFLFSFFSYFLFMIQLYFKNWILFCVLCFVFGLILFLMNKSLSFLFFLFFFFYFFDFIWFMRKKETTATERMRGKKKKRKKEEEEATERMREKKEI